MSGPKTVIEFVKEVESYLRGRGVGTSPRLDAELLVANATGMKRLDLYLQFDRPLDAAEIDKLRGSTRRRAASEPIAYILGEREFFSLPFFVSPAVLVPRPETEHVVEEALRLLRDAPPGRGGILGADLGTGSGCIAVSLLTRVPDLRMIGIDVSPAALAVAAANAERHAVGDRFKASESDLAAALARDLKGASLDLLVSNPPYVADAEIAGLPADVRDHEPRGALAGGADGLVLLRAIARGAPRVLKPGGVLVLEFGRGQADAVASFLAESGAFENPRIVKDFASLPRVASARRR